MNNKTYDLLVIGGGPAGYVAAIRAAQLGLSVAVLERNKLGGTCLNVGCIPTKTLFRSAEAADMVRDAGQFGVDAVLNRIDYASVVKRKDAVVKQLVSGVGYLLKKNKVDVINGTARILSADSVKKVKNVESGEIYSAKNILIATGSVNAVPPIPGLDGKQILDSTALLALTEMPKSLLIIGGGVIGCEFAGIFHSFGCEVTIVEMMPSLLSNMDKDLASAAEAQFLAKGIHMELGAKVVSIADEDGKKSVTFEKDGSKKSISAEYVLVSVGRKANTCELGCEELGIKSQKGFIVVDEQMQTSIPGIYAAGDITGVGMLAHTAFAGGTAAAENIAGRHKELSLKSVPKVVFLGSEIASVGMTEDEAKAGGHDVIIGKFNITGNGRALALGNTDGFVKVVAGKQYHEILGVHMVGPEASELIAVGAQLIEMEALLEDVENTIYPHPAIAECIKEACLSALGNPIHA